MFGRGLRKFLKVSPCQVLNRVRRMQDESLVLEAHP